MRIHRAPAVITALAAMLTAQSSCSSDPSSPAGSDGSATAQPTEPTSTESRDPTDSTDPADTASSSVAPQTDAPAPQVGLAPVTDDNPVVNDSFVSPLVERYGDVSIGSGSFVAGNTTLRADPDGAVCIGSASNVQDNVLLLALQAEPNTHEPGECGELSASSGDEASVAHQAVITNSTLGDFVFVGFHAQIRDSVVEDGAFILHGALIEGVTIPADSLVDIGQQVTTQEEADALPKLTEDNNAFKLEVLEVNAEFAEGYVELYEADGYEAVTGVSKGPRTEWNPDPVAPTIGEDVVLEPFARVVGDVRLGADSTVGRRTSIRADEGAPIEIGARAEIEDRVTFHALKDTSIKIGADLDTDDNVVLHGPLTVGRRLTIQDDAVLFRSEVGNNVTIGERALVVGVTLPDATYVPPDAVITNQGQADALAD